jgi:hypothetical protein
MAVWEVVMRERMGRMRGVNEVDYNECYREQHVSSKAAKHFQ